MRSTSSPRQLCRLLIEECNKNTKTSKERLIKAADSDADLHIYLLNLGAQQAIRSYFRDERKHGRVSDLSEDEIEDRMAEKTRRRLFWDRYALFGHVALPTANRGNLKVSIDARRTQATGNLNCARFEEALMQKMRNDRVVVKDVFTNEQILKLARQHHVIPEEWS